MNIPRLALNFTSAVLNPVVTFTRSGATATLVNSSGLIESVAADTPRFDYNPITLACNGLLVEESRANLFLRSQEMDVSPWASGAHNTGIETNQTTAPDNTLTAERLYENTNTSNHFIAQSVSFTSGVTYTISVFLKKGTRATAPDILQMTLPALAFGTQYANYNISTGQVVTESGGTGTITVYRNGWYRATYTATATSTQTTISVAVGFTNNNASLGRLPSYTGSTNSDVFVWGAQLEAGEVATSYIPTTSAAMTRNADVATITGSNFTSFWNAAQGGAQVQALPSTVSGIRPLVQYDDGTANEIIALRGNTTNPELYIVDGGTPQAQLDAGTIAASTAYSLTGWWSANDCRARKDSGAAVTDATATIPTVTQARIGSDGTNYLNGTIATINYYAAFSSQIYTRRKNKVVSSLF